MPGWIPRRLGQLIPLHQHLKCAFLLLRDSHGVTSVLGGGLGGKKESGQLRFGGRERPFRAPLYVALLLPLT